MARNEKKASASAQPPLPTFEKSLEQLEKIVHDIECGEVTLEQSLEQYEQGMKLIQHCRSILERAETKIRMLTADEKGQVREDDR
jgi:exodeoxyribonuclease VII small subunit